MLQHLLTGSISNSAVDVLRTSCSVEVRMFGVNKGVSLSRIMDLMARHLGGAAVTFDVAVAIGRFMSRDESVFSYLEGTRPLLDRAMRCIRCLWSMVTTFASA